MKKKLLYNIIVLADDPFNSLYTSIINIYNENTVVRVFIFRVSDTEIIAEILSI